MASCFEGEYICDIIIDSYVESMQIHNKNHSTVKLHFI